jgi:hypothetical protein
MDKAQAIREGLDVPAPDLGELGSPKFIKDVPSESLLVASDHGRLEDPSGFRAHIARLHPQQHLLTGFP